MLNFLFPVPLSLLSSLLCRLSLKIFDEKHINLAKRGAVGRSIEAISLLTLIYWQRINEHECISVCACVSICVHTLRQGLTALCVFVCLCVCALSHSSKCAAGIPGHLREQRKADCRAEEDVGSEHRLLEKRVGEEGMRKSWRAWIFCSPTPCKQPWARGRRFDSMRLADLAAGRPTVLYCCKNLYSFMQCLT